MSEPLNYMARGEKDDAPVVKLNGPQAACPFRHHLVCEMVNMETHLKVDGCQVDIGCLGLETFVVVPVGPYSLPSVVEIVAIENQESDQNQPLVSVVEVEEKKAVLEKLEAVNPAAIPCLVLEVTVESEVDLVHAAGEEQAL